MTQVWPGRGLAPVPTWVSMICNPEGVVTVFPTWAVAVVGVKQTPVKAATRASAVIALGRSRILYLLRSRESNLLRRSIGSLSDTAAVDIRACARPAQS